MLLKKLLRTIWRYKAQFISMIIMVLLGVGVFVGFQGEWYSIEKDTYAFYDATGFADYRLVDRSGYSDADLEKILALDGVTDGGRYLAVNTNESIENDIIALTVTTNAKVSGFVVTDGENYDENSVDGVWLSDMYAEKNGYKVGDTINLKYNSINIEGKIKGLIKSSEYLICVPDESQMMPDFNTYGYLYISPVMLKSVLGFEYYTEIHVLSELSKSVFAERADAALGKTNLLLTKDDVTSFSEAQGEATEGKTMASILPVIFLGIAILIMLTTMQRITINEKTQIGILKALGFRDARILRHYTFFGLFIGLVGSILGILFGYFIAWFIFNPTGSMGTYFDLLSWDIAVPWWTFAVVALLVVFMTLISYFSVKKVLRGNAADTLKPYAPKVMKRTRAENSKIWRKLKFSVKWNIRDILRHKARSGMTLFGVTGCMILLVASFLMMDSMVGFVNGFYDKSMNYETTFYLSQETDNGKAKAIAAHFDGDYEAQSAVSLNDEAVSMEIYNVSHDLVRFPDSQMNYKKLGDDGVYIGQRLKEEHGLNIGDTFTVSPYGQNISYELTVAGEVRSLSKSIIMTENYANSIGIDHVITQIYTNESAAAVSADTLFKDNISSIKAKSDVIKSFDSFMEVMYVMIGALIVLSVILGVVVLYNLGIMSYFERYRELSTLKVVGFRDRKIGKLLITQNMWLTVLGCIIGFPLGILITDIMMKALASEYEMILIFGPMTFTIPVILVLATGLFVSLLVAAKNRKIDMVEALKVPE